MIRGHLTLFCNIYWLGSISHCSANCWRPFSDYKIRSSNINFFFFFNTYFCFVLYLTFDMCKKLNCLYWYLWQIYLPTGAYVKVSRGKKRTSQFINVQVKSSSSDYGLTEGILFKVKSIGGKRRSKCLWVWSEMMWLIGCYSKYHMHIHDKNKFNNILKTV